MPSVDNFLSQLYETDVVVVGGAVEVWMVDGIYDLVLLASSLYWETTDVLTHSHAKAVDAYPGGKNGSQC